MDMIMEGKFGYMAALRTPRIVPVEIKKAVKKLRRVPLTGEDVMVGGFASASTITQMFDITTMIPPYFLQIIIGVYLIEIIFILTKCLVTIQSGVDVLGEKVEIAKNLKRGMFLYFIITLIAVVALSLLAGIAIGQFGV
ncbi:hypothetical protein CO154_00750 [Candidatus Pacearchaeota archaeon CG_4_9_14_3_um_filter_31_7]|nr:MAG: hypothetical protein CO154_00750 [Candidatus Pacearchaeota archaeon CG_4_9_14_3_um_filter_31_7]